MRQKTNFTTEELFKLKETGNQLSLESDDYLLEKIR